MEVERVLSDKFCTKCRENKDVICFSKDKNRKDGLSPWCKNCCAKNKSNWYKKSKDKITKYGKEYYQKNREELLKEIKEYKEKNKERVSAYKKTWIENNKEHVAKLIQEWKKKNKDYYNKTRNKRNKKRRQQDVLFKLISNLRSRLSNGVRSKKWYKNSIFSEYLGCTLEQLRDYLEKQFMQGMTWENYGELWQIDHVMALGLAKTIEEMIKFCHYTNLQPLWKEDHKKKTAIDIGKINNKNE